MELHSQAPSAEIGPEGLHQTSGRFGVEHEADRRAARMVKRDRYRAVVSHRMNRTQGRPDYHVVPSTPGVVAAALRRPDNATARKVQFAGDLVSQGRGGSQAGHMDGDRFEVRSKFDPLHNLIGDGPDQFF